MIPYKEPYIRLLQDENPAAVELAEAVSCAAVVEPQLLRVARRELVPHADAGAEADVWLSPLVESRSPSAIVFDRNIAQILSRHLRERNPALSEQAWALLRRRHASAPLTTQVEEKINYLLVAVDQNTAARDLEQTFWSVTLTLQRDPNRPGLANWAARLLSRLPEQVRKLESAQAMAAAVYVRLAGFLPVSPDNNQTPDWLPWVVPADFPQRDIRVRFISRGIEFSSLSQEPPCIRLPATDPLLVDVIWSEGDRRILQRVDLIPGTATVVESSTEKIELRTIVGRRYSLQKTEVKPSVSPASPIRPTCYVSMGFGTKTDYQTGRVLDLDKTYRDIIKPSAEATGYECTRADEIHTSGIIDAPPFERILSADVMIADISTLNANALYELGIRHALRPFTTVVLAEDKLALPFDPVSPNVLRYRFTGDGIDYSEAERMRADLTRILKNVLGHPSTDSPVYTLLTNLEPPVLRQATTDVVKPAAPDPSRPELANSAAKRKSKPKPRASSKRK